MAYAKQPSAMPTNKLMVGTTVATIVGTQLSPAVAEVWPLMVPAVLAGPSVTDLVAAVVTLMAGLAAGWVVPDRAVKE
jgi:hypothetical protein